MEENLATEIASKIQHETFQQQNIKSFFRILSEQKNYYQEFFYLGDGPSELILAAKKDGTQMVALKIVDLREVKLPAIRAASSEYAALLDRSDSDYLLKVFQEFDLTDQLEEKLNEHSMPKPIFFVQELEFCSETLRDILKGFREKNENPSKTFKETIAIQMLDALNLLHSQGVIHRNIKPSSFFVETNYNKVSDFPYCLKLREISSAAPSSFIQTPDNYASKTNGTRNYIAPEAQGQERKYYIESDLYSLGVVLLELDNVLDFDVSKMSPSQFQKGLKGDSCMFEDCSLNRSSLLYKIACTFLKKPHKERESASSMLWQLIRKSKGKTNIPTFSIFQKHQINAILQTIQFSKHQEQQQQQLISRIEQISDSQRYLNLLLSKWHSNEQSSENKQQLTQQLLCSALETMFDFEDFRGEFDLLGFDTSSVILGAKNLQHNNRSCVLRLSLCPSKAEALREISLLKMCQIPYIVEFYGYRFFQDRQDNQFVLLELERCQCSLRQYLQQQWIDGECSQIQKERMMVQMIDSVSYLHKNEIIHGNLSLDSFLVSTNESGEITVKLKDFHGSSQLQYHSDFRQYYLNYVFAFVPPFQCAMNNSYGTMTPSSIPYFAPERWQDQFPSTIKSDCFSIGICLIFLDNYLILSDSQLEKEYFSFLFQKASDLFSESSKININKNSKIFKESQKYLKFLSQQREYLSSFIESLDWNKVCSLYSQIIEYPFKDQKQQTVSLFIQYIPNNGLSNCLNYLANLDDLFTLSLDMNSKQIGDNDNNQGSSILQPLSNLINLQSLFLNLSDNALRPLNVQGQSLFTPLSKCNHLSTLGLYLNSNQIGDEASQFLLSPLINLTSLLALQLDLSYNRIGDIGAKYLLSPLEKLINLTSFFLDLKSNQISDDGAQYLLCPLANFINLSDLSINLNTNLIQSDGAQHLLSSLMNLVNLKTISLSLNNNSIGSLGAKYLLSSLVNLVNITTLSLSLSECELEKESSIHLLVPLQNLINLQTLNLDLQDNQIEAEGARFLLSPLINLTTLSILSLKLSKNRISNEGALFLLSPLKNLLNLSTLYLNIVNNGIESQGAKGLLSALASLNNIQTLSLDLNQNAIGDIGANNLLSPLSELSNILSFSLALKGNKIQEEGAKGLLYALKQHNNLQKLSLKLDENQFKDQGAKYLLVPLTGLTKISNLSLTLEKNEIEAEGAKYLLQPISDMHNLLSLSLELNLNMIGENGARFLLAPLSSLKKLQSLFFKFSSVFKYQETKNLLCPLATLQNLSNLSLILSNNKITTECVKYLLSSITNLSNLSSIFIGLSYNKIDLTGAQYILSFFTHFLNLSSLSLVLGNIFEDKNIKHIVSLLYSHLKKISIC